MSAATRPALRAQAVFHVYDTTLRDGAQQEGMHLSVADKLAIARLLDSLGIGFIEGGWPGAIPKDTEFFARARRDLSLRHAMLAAFGATRRPESVAERDPQVRALLDAETPMVTLVAKSDIRHVERALRTSGAENLAMIRQTVALLVGEGRRVVLDAEHFFDGYGYDATYARTVVQEAFDAGADVVALCDTNGGMLPGGVGEIVTKLRSDLGLAHGSALAPGDPVVGIHAHNDSGCAVANTLAAVEAGAAHVQGTVNGYGERTGNVDLATVLANLELKCGLPVLPAGRLAEVTGIAHAVSEITNIAPYSRQPYVGASAFAHKAGLHASAIKVDPDLYQHIEPTDVGNDLRMLVSEMAGRASIELKGRELGHDLSGQSDLLTRVAARVKENEARGYTYDAADASFDLLLREESAGERPHYFQVESWRVIVERRGVRGTEAVSEATIKLTAGGERHITTGEGNGPVNALDEALRAALVRVYPRIDEFELIDFKVRILEAEQGTDATTRVLIQMTDGQDSWSTVGVGPNLIEAAWEALTDAAVYGLIRAGVPES